jgi:ABC-type ATPase involved in cell division
MSDPAILVRDLTRRFGAFTAVDRINFEVERGEIFGFLGANGAGKSTAIRMMCGLLKPTSGTAVVDGVDVSRDPEDVKRRIGYMSQKFSLYEALTVEQNIRFFGALYGLNDEQIARRMKFVVDMAGLSGRESTRARDLAGGWRQRLALGCAILHEPASSFSTNRPGVSIRVAPPVLAAHRIDVARRRHDARDHALHRRGRALPPHRHYERRQARRDGHPANSRRFSQRADSRNPFEPAGRCHGALEENPSVEKPPCSAPPYAVLRRPTSISKR